MFQRAFDNLEADKEALAEAQAESDADKDAPHVNKLLL
jgi:hypothetical protein